MSRKTFVLELSLNECIALAKALHFFGRHAMKQKYVPSDIFETLMLLHAVVEKLPGDEDVENLRSTEDIV